MVSLDNFNSSTTNWANEERKYIMHIWLGEWNIEFNTGTG